MGGDGDGEAVGLGSWELGLGWSVGARKEGGEVVGWVDLGSLGSLVLRLGVPRVKAFTSFSFCLFGKANKRSRLKINY